AEDLLGSRTRPVHQHVAGAPQVPAEERELPERLLRDDAELKGKRGEHHRYVVDALMIRDEHVGSSRLESLKTIHPNTYNATRQDERRARAREPVRKVPALREQARSDRQRGENDGVESDGGNEEENCAPPVKGRNRQGQRAKGQGKVKVQGSGTRLRFQVLGLSRDLWPLSPALTFDLSPFTFDLAALSSPPLTFDLAALISPPPRRGGHAALRPPSVPAWARPAAPAPGRGSGRKSSCRPSSAARS